MIYYQKKVGGHMYEYLGNTEISLYKVLNIVGFFALMLFNFSQLNKKKAFLGKVSKNILSKTKNIKLVPPMSKEFKDSVSFKISDSNPMDYF